MAKWTLPENERIKPDPFPIVIRKVLLSDAIQNLIGAEEWDLTEEEEMTLWEIIRKIESQSNG